MVSSALAARRGRLLLALMAVTLGIAVSTALATLSLQVGDDLARTLRAAGPNFVALPAGAQLPLDLGGASFTPARAGLALSDTSASGLKFSFWKNNVLDATPEMDATVRIDRSPVKLKGTWFAHGLAPAGEPWTTGVATLRPHWRVTGRWPQEGARELALGREAASRLALDPGRAVTLESGGSSERWLVTGVVDHSGAAGNHAWAPLDQVQRLLGRGGQIDRMWISAMVLPAPRHAAPDAASDPEAYERYMCAAYPVNVASGLRTQLAGAEVLPMTEVVAGEGMVVRRLNLLMVLLALAALAAATLGLLSTTTATVVERRVELGLLRSLGAGPRQIASLLLGRRCWWRSRVERSAGRSASPRRRRSAATLSAPRARCPRSCSRWRCWWRSRSASSARSALCAWRSDSTPRRCSVAKPDFGMEARLLRAALLRGRGTVLLAVIAVAIGASVASALLHVSGDVSRKLSHELRALGPNLLVVPGAAAASGAAPAIAADDAAPHDFLSESNLRRRLAAAGLEAAPLLYVVARVKGEAVQVIGADLEKVRTLHPGWNVPAGDAKSWMGVRLQRRLGVSPGDPLTLEFPATGTRMSLPAGAPLEAGSADDEAWWLPLADAQALAGMPDRVSLAQARVEGGTRAAAAIARSLEADPALRVLPIHSLSATEAGLLDRMRKLMHLVTAAALVAAGLCAFGSLTDLALERRRELALMKALGAGPRDVLRQFMVEAAAIGAIGGIAGWRSAC